MKKLFLFLSLLVFAPLVYGQAKTFPSYGAGNSFYQSCYPAAIGYLWYNTDTKTLQVYADSVYRSTITNQSVGGDLTGTLPNPTIGSITNFNIGVDTQRTVDFTIPVTKSVFPVSTAANSVHATLPSAVGLKGHVVTIFIRAGTDSLTVRYTAPSVINGIDSFMVGHAAYNTATFVATDSTWQVVAKN